MPWLLFILRLLLNLLSGNGRGLSLAARPDGRVEQVPADGAELLGAWQPRRQRQAVRKATVPSSRAPNLPAPDESPPDSPRQ